MCESLEVISIGVAVISVSVAVLSLGATIAIIKHLFG
jgi:hypothetical protein